MTAPFAAATANKPRGRRKPPSPDSVLDPAALRRALDDANITVSPAHISAFYHALHRQGYPSLPDFCKTYEFYAENIGNVDVLPPVQQIPLRNSITLKRNRNKTHLPKVFLDFLKTTTSLTTMTSKILKQQTSNDKSTTKLAIELHDGNVVESVLMRYANHHKPNRSGGRASLCVSSQVGCAMGCTFCATGTMGLFGNLTAGEILEQIVHADKILAAERFQNERENENQLRTATHDFVRNVVFMGMGEPLDNYTHVTSACRALIDPRRWNLAHHCVTVSTVGIVSQIRKLTADLPQVSLALSLHAPNQAARQAIVPTASRYPIEQLVEALDNHMNSFKHKRRSDGSIVKGSLPRTPYKRRAMIEYVMLQGPTSTLECAHELGQLCQHKSLIVNLIPYNATNVADVLHCPSEEHMQDFRRIVASYKVFCTIRRTMGADIDSACGQLVQDVFEKRQQKSDCSSNVVDIEDVVGANKSNVAAAAAEGKKTILSSSLDHGATTPAANETKLPVAEATYLESLIAPLAVATAVSASCFLLSLALYAKPRLR
ncbi:hypothetical protein MPSEU_000835300 [Mayamaea pseudoterrestris]|nr:hypothetical protein MPSEU_000835300 [Mayamaea pseudoterrestris]